MCTVSLWNGWETSCILYWLWVLWGIPWERGSGSSLPWSRVARSIGCNLGPVMLCSVWRACFWRMWSIRGWLLSWRRIWVICVCMCICRWTLLRRSSSLWWEDKCIRLPSPILTWSIVIKPYWLGKKNRSAIIDRSCPMGWINWRRLMRPLRIWRRNWWICSPFCWWKTQKFRNWSKVWPKINVWPTMLRKWWKPRRGKSTFKARKSLRWKMRLTRFSKLPNRSLRTPSNN